MDYNVAFGTTFKRLRRLKRMTQEDFGAVVSERYVRMLEKGVLANLGDCCRSRSGLADESGYADYAGAGGVFGFGCGESNGRGGEGYAGFWWG